MAEPPSPDRLIPQRHSSSRTRRFLRLGLKFGFSIALTLILLEVGLRILGIRPLTQVREHHDPDLLHPVAAIAEAQRAGWIPWPRETRRIDAVKEHRRGYIEITRNNLSCREDGETSLEKVPGVTRVLVLGDSHTDGVCFNEESYPNLLEAEWNRRAERPAYEIINAGFGPSSPYQQWWAFEQVYQRLDPDHLIVAWYAGNDLVELLRSDERVHLKWTGQEFVHEAPTKANDDTRSAPTTWSLCKAFLRDRLSLYHALVQIRALRKMVRSAEQDEYRERLESAMAAHAGPVWQGLNQSYYFTHHPEAWESALRMMAHILDKYRAYADEHEISLTVVVIPTLRQVHPEYDDDGLRATIETLALGEADLEWDARACQALVELCRERNVTVVDMREPLRLATRRSPEQPVYYRFDHHLNVHGNRILAAELDRTLVQQIPTAFPPADKPSKE